MNMNITGLWRNISRRGYAAVAAVLLANLVMSAGVDAQQPVPQGVNATDVILVVDESSTMWLKNDPAVATKSKQINPGWRIAAINQLAALLATDQSGTKYQFGVIFFGSAAKVVFPLQPLTTASAQTALQQAIANNHRDMGATNIVPTLTIVRDQLAKSAQPAAKKVVIYLSDGVCEPIMNATVAQRRVCEDDLRTSLQQNLLQQGNVHVSTVALTPDASAVDPSLASANMKNMWQEIAVKTGGQYYEAARAEGDLVTIFTRIQEDLMVLPELLAPAPVTSPGTQEFKLPADLSQVIFTVVTNDPAITSSVIRANGTEIKSADSDARLFHGGSVSAVSIAKPAAGVWRITSTGAGVLTAIVIPDDTRQKSVVTPTVTLPGLQLELDTPNRTHPQNKPMNIRARLLDDQQNPLSVQNFMLTVTLPSGSIVTPTLSNQGLAYTAVLTDTTKKGVYTLMFSGKVGAQVFTDQHAINVQMLPWLKLNAPDIGVTYSDRIPVRVQVLLGSSPMGALQPGDQMQIVAHLVSSTGQDVDAAPLRPGVLGAAASVYSATLAAAISGPNVMHVTLTYIASGGEKYEDTADVPVFVVGGVPATVPTMTPTAVPTAAPVAAVSTSPGLSLSGIMQGELAPIYIAIGILAVMVLFSLMVALLQVNALLGIKSVFVRSVEAQDVIIRAGHKREIIAQLKNDGSWKPLVDQVVADAMQEPMSIDEEAGVLDLMIEPSPKFTLMTHDGRHVIFTTDPWALKRMKLIQRGDRVVDISALSRVTHLDAGIIWMCMLDKRRLPHVAVPANAHWYVVMRSADIRNALPNVKLLRPGRVPFLDEPGTQPAPGGDA